MQLPHEVDSPEYWDHFDWVLQSPFLRSSVYLQPLFMVREDDISSLCEDEIERSGDCLCLRD